MPGAKKIAVSVIVLHLAKTRTICPIMVPFPASIAKLFSNTVKTRALYRKMDKSSTNARKKRQESVAHIIKPKPKTSAKNADI